MAITQNNISWVGQGPTGSNQVNAEATGAGAEAKSLDGFGQLKLDGSATTVTLNFIDGVQGFGRSTVLQLNQAFAAANSATKYSTLSGTYGGFVGQSIVIAGFTNSANNGTFTVNSIGSGFIVVSNSSGVAETNPAGTGVVSINSIPAVVSVSRQIQPSDTAATSTTVIQTGAVTATGIPVTISAAGSNAQLLSYNVRVGFAS